MDGLFVTGDGRAEVAFFLLLERLVELGLGILLVGHRGVGAGEVVMCALAFGDGERRGAAVRQRDAADDQQHGE